MELISRVLRPWRSANNETIDRILSFTPSVTPSISGESIASFSLQARMEKAKELLTSTNNTLQMIAEELGYTEGNNFQAIFKQSVGDAGGVEEKANLSGVTVLPRIFGLFRVIFSPSNPPLWGIIWYLYYPP